MHVPALLTLRPRLVAMLAATALCALPASSRAQPAASLSEITAAELTNIPSGCSFVLYNERKQIVAISTNALEKRVSFWFKIDGSIFEAKGTARKTNLPGFIEQWSGTVRGEVMTIVKKNAQGNRNKPGEDSLFHGDATLTTKSGNMNMTWEAGC